MSVEWRGEIPTRIHEKGAFGLGSAPPYSPEFIDYIGKLTCSQPGCKECGGGNRDDKLTTERPMHHEGRRRTKRAMTRLRKVAPREFDALYMYCVLRYSPVEIVNSMNRRAVRLGKPERYTLATVMVLLMSGADKTRKIW